MRFLMIWGGDLGWQYVYGCTWFKGEKIVRAGDQMDKAVAGFDLNEYEKTFPEHRFMVWQLDS